MTVDTRKEDFLQFIEEVFVPETSKLSRHDKNAAMFTLTALLRYGFT